MKKFAKLLTTLLSIITIIIITSTLTGCQFKFPWQSKENDENECKTHDFSIIVVKNEYPTDVTPQCCSFTIKECAKCGEKQTIESKHIFDTPYISNNDATCFKDGTKSRTCSKCGKYKETVIDEGSKLLNSHTFTDEWEVILEPTLEAAGSYKGFCTICNTDVTIELPAFNKEDYIWEQIVTPECNKTGIDKYVFKYYGVEVSECTFTVTTAAIHTDINDSTIDKNKMYGLDYVQTYGEVEADGEPTCQETCRGVLYCKYCNGAVIVNVIGEHIKGAEITDRYVPATCENEGHRYYTCEREGCQAEDSTIHEIIPILEHTYEHEVIEPTCVEDGYTKHACIYCDYEYIDTPVDKLTTSGHKYELMITPGGKHYNLTTMVADFECSYCKDKKYEILIECVETYEPTDCSRSGYVKYSTIDEIEATFEIEKPILKKHLCGGIRFLSNTNITNEYTAEIDKLFKEGKFTWLDGFTSSEGNYAAYYYCEDENCIYYGTDTPLLIYFNKKSLD